MPCWSSDSNYHLQYNIATRERDDVNWTLFAPGTVEPNTQILLDEVTRDDLPAFDRLSVQLTAYKTGKAIRTQTSGFCRDKNRHYQICQTPLLFQVALLSCSCADNTHRH